MRSKYKSSIKGNKNTTNFKRHDAFRANDFEKYDIRENRNKFLELYSLNRTQNNDTAPNNFKFIPNINFRTNVNSENISSNNTEDGNL